MYVSHERARELLTDKHALGADLVIEIASPSTRRRDETLKLKLYERAGVREYWFVDPDRDVIRVYRRTLHEFATPDSFSGTDAVVISPLLPGFKLHLRKMFE